MLTPGEIVQRAGRCYVPYLRAWLQEAPFFPLALPVGKLPTDYLQLSQAVGQLLKGSKAQRGYGYQVELHTHATQRYGMQSLPTRILIETESDFLRLLGKTEEFRAFQQDIALIRQQVPQLSEWVIQQPQHVLEQHGTWPELLQVCAYFLAHPQPNRYPRELPIPVHTKFIETHMGILRRLLDAALPAEAIAAEESVFERRFGLRYVEPLIRFRLLDEKLCQRYQFPLSDISTPLSLFATLPLRNHHCLITENKLTFLTLPSLPDTFAIFGEGFGIEVLTGIDWLNGCSLFYWGDLDAQGFQILSKLRSAFPQVTSVLMDEATFEAFHEYAVRGVPCDVSDLPHLREAEHALFQRLAREQVRLEQEHLSQAFVTNRLTSCIAPVEEQAGQFYQAARMDSASTQPGQDDS
jgi:hypothetical protein